MRDDRIRRGGEEEDEGMLGSDPFDLESLRLADLSLESVVLKRRPPRHRRGDPFLKGPISYAWIASACRLPGSGFHVAMSCRFQAKRFGFSRGRRWGMGDIAEGLRISDDSARRGLHAAERARLVSVVREPGCKPTITILEFVGAAAEPKRRPLYGPIPWSWWAPASRLPGKALQTATVCWLLAGWEKSAEIELIWDDWSEFGLSQSSAHRGLVALERAGLVKAVRQPGRSPIVTILDPAAAPERNGIPTRIIDLV
jgi:hypothetical protein